MTDPESEIRVDRDGPVATVTLCRPHVLNAQTPRMWERLRSIARDLTGDVRVVVLRGEGRSFSAGLDLSALSGPADDPTSIVGIATLAEDEANARIAGYQEAFAWLRRPDLISVAAVQGHAIGAGFQLALACDLRICTQDAKFTMAEVSLGLVPDLGGTKRLVDLVGYARALEICVTGRRISADEALRFGLVTSVVELEALDDAVAELTAQLLAANRDAVIEVKALLAAAVGHSFPDQERAEREAQVRLIHALVGKGE
ncbi:MAG TPA: enoyl-CoA hydratase/isomerase family protein [Micromonosporaceae bacterium]|jgi:enoyl-CoA hydratase/carnithine racemase